MHVPLNLDHPYWVADTAFDLEFHVRHIALPKPGEGRQLCMQAAFDELLTAAQAAKAGS